MAVITPAAARHQAGWAGDQLVITIPSRKHWFQIPFLAVWLIFWSFGWFAAFTGLALAPGGGHLFLLLWLTFWTVGGLFAFSTLLWMLVGREKITVSADKFIIRRQIGSLGWSKTFATLDLCDLRVAPAVRPWYGRKHNNLQFLWQFDGPITFDYGARTYHCGDGVDEAEAKQIVKLIGQQFPQIQ